MNRLTAATKQGLVRGKLSKNYRNGTFYSFFGIPYATPPLGKLRFKAPQPPAPWKGILDATAEKEGCVAVNTYTGKMEGTEDCLHLNVYTSEINQNEGSKLKPVLVFVHGGSFTMGNTKTEIYGPDFLLTQDVVLVLISYRLGALGWLRFQDGSLGVPGNHGIRDVIMALKWIQENIESFAGNPNNVTLFGQSSSGILLHYLMLSASSQDLFHKIIFHTCTALVPVIGRRDSVKILAENLNCPSELDKDVLEYLQKQPVEKIFEVQSKIDVGFKPSLLKTFYPIIENTGNIEEPIILDEPRNIIDTGEYTKVPMMIGCNSNEGLFFEYQIKSKLRRDSNAELITDFETMVPVSLGFKKGSPQSRKIAEEIKLFYFDGRNPTAKDRQQFHRLLADYYFHYSLQDTVKRHFKTLGHPIYFFKFSVDAKLNLYKKLQGVDLPGASHSDELCYLFKMSKNPAVEENSVEDKTIQRMVKLWTNFARSGDPNVEKSDDLINVKWIPIEENKINYLNIGQELTTGTDPDKKSADFWETMYNKSTLAKL